MRSRLLIVTALWGRHDLTNEVLLHYALMTERVDFDIQLLCVGSEGETSRHLAQAHGWDYTEYPNEPLSQKFNHLFQTAQTYDFDLLVLAGSDDLISEEVLRFYATRFTSKHKDVVGLRDIYFYSIGLDQLIHFPGYALPAPRTIGAGRCFSLNILRSIGWRPWREERLNRGLDSACTTALKRIGIHEEVYSMHETGGIVVDVKDQMVNLTAWERVATISTPVDRDEKFRLIERHFPGTLLRLREMKKEFIFVPNQDYKVRVISPSHPAYGQEITVTGEAAIQLQIKQVIEYP